MNRKDKQSFCYIVFSQSKRRNQNGCQLSTDYRRYYDDQRLRFGIWKRGGCYKLVSIASSDRGPVNFVVTPTTYFVDHAVVTIGDLITGFYDANAPAPAIYPPQLQALIIAKASPYQSVKVDYFDSQLVSSDGALKLNISPGTRMILENGQSFTGDPANRYLIVIYSVTTRSIPAQTSPDEIVVICSQMQ